MCDDANHDASHMGEYNTAYESLVDRLRACRRDLYIKKQVNRIIGWSKKLSELNTILEMQLRLGIKLVAPFMAFYGKIKET